MTFTVLIVDDEPLGRRNLQSLLEGEPDVRLLGECRNGEEAVEAVRQLRPDLVFLDIQMPRLDGFGVLAELGSARPPHVVFVTAFDSYAIRAFEVRALDYLLKPVSRDRFSEALDRARRAAPLGQETFAGLLQEMEARRPRIERFPVRQGSEIVFLRLVDIEAIEATGNWMHIHTPHQSHMVRDSLASLEDRLDPQRFIRVHRSWILGVRHIRKVLFEGGGSAQATLLSGRQVPISRSCREQVEALIARLGGGSPPKPAGPAET